MSVLKPNVCHLVNSKQIVQNIFNNNITLKQFITAPELDTHRSSCPVTPLAPSCESIGTNYYVIYYIVFATECYVYWLICLFAQQSTIVIIDAQCLIVLAFSKFHCCEPNADVMQIFIYTIILLTVSVSLSLSVLLIWGLYRPSSEPIALRNVFHSTYSTYY